MFYNCSSLKQINLTNFINNNINDKDDIFTGCLNVLKMKIRNQFKNLKKEIFE